MKILFLKSLLLSCFFALLQPVIAQEATLIWSDDLSFGKNITAEQFLGVQGGNMFLQTHKNEAGVKITFEGLQSSFKQTQNIGNISLKSTDVAQQGNIVVEDKGATLLGIVFAKNKKWFFAKSNVPKSDVTVIKAYRLNSKMEVKGSPIEIHSFTNGQSNKQEFNYKNKEYDPDTKLIISKDSSKIAMCIKAGNVFLCKVYDANTMKLIWETQTKIETKKPCSIDQILLTNEGKLYFVGKTFKYGKEKSSTFNGVKTYYTPIENEEAMFFSLVAGKENAEPHHLGLKNAEISSTYLTTRENGHLAIFTGYVLAEKKGFAYYDIDAEDNVAANFEIIPSPAKIKNIKEHSFDKNT